MNNKSNYELSSRQIKIRTPLPIRLEAREISGPSGCLWRDVASNPDVFFQDHISLRVI